jgi:redox-sensitive bicupin YhaK (pirin superfamily)
MSNTIRSVAPLGFPWEPFDPFLICVYHEDFYPAGNGQLGPAASLEGRRMGADFAGKDGWRMYHGETVPGFPPHPHRGFETVTLVRRGLIDHTDSTGAAARFGAGDVQWVTAGRGVMHAEMFPLVDPEGPNPLELFQIWLNLPAASKMVEPHFEMLWREQIPRRVLRDAEGRETEVVVVAGAFGDARPPAPPPSSYASRPEADVAIWTVRMQPGAQVTLPAASEGVERALFYFRGSGLTADGTPVGGQQRIRARGDRPLVLDNGGDEAELLLLQGRPIGEPVAQRGPFVMNTAAELDQAMVDFRRTQFGGWPWPVSDPVHARKAARFARHGDGRSEEPGSA